MDGVLIDSNPLHRQAWAAYNRRFGRETDEAMQQRMYGRRNDEIVRDFFGPHLSAEEVRAHGAAKEALYRELFAASVGEHLVPGVHDFLRRHAACPVGLATNAEPANVAFVLAATGLERFFRVIVDGHQVARPKPDPEIFVCAARRLGVPPSRCIVFEDSHAGVEAACAAGMCIVGVRTTHRELPGAALTIDDFRSRELRSWLLARQ